MRRAFQRVAKVAKGHFCEFNAAFAARKRSERQKLQGTDPKGVNRSAASPFLGLAA